MNVVRVLDTTHLKEQYLEQFKEHAPEWDIVDIVDNGPVSLVDTKDGTFVVNYKGAGFPVTDTGECIVLHFFPKLRNGAILYNVPISSIVLTQENLKLFPIKEETTIEDFIMRISPDHDKLIENWKSILKPVEKDCILVRSQKSLTTYSTFLRNRICECYNSEDLIEVVENICCRKDRHVHCKSCGGVKL